MTKTKTTLPDSGREVTIDSCGDTELWYVGENDFGMAISSIELSSDDLEFLLKETIRYKNAMKSAKNS